MKKILSQITDDIRVVSFDVFDTLIVRPLYNPSDLFFFIEQDVQKTIKTLDIYPFHDLRILAEENARHKSNQDEVTLHDIYYELGKLWTLPDHFLQDLYKKEIEYEIRFCKRRESIYKLYRQLKEMGKKILFISDMYLDSKDIRTILLNAGYDDEKLFVSSSHKKTKLSGELYNIAYRNIDKKTILHIGDNINSDFLSAKKFGITPIKINSTVENFSLFINKINTTCDIYSQTVSSKYLGLRCVYALCANKFFDSTDTPDIYAPSFVGYIYLGLHLYALSQWLIKSTKNYKSIVFCSRDGYIPMKSVKKILNSINIKKCIKYVFTSRRALIPLFFVGENIEVLINQLKYADFTQKRMIQIVGPFLDSAFLAKHSPDSTPFKSQTDFINYLKVIKNNINSNALDTYIKECKKYFDKFFCEKSALFDIGYSIRTETILHNIYGYNIDSFYLHTISDIGMRRSSAYGIYENSFYNFLPKFAGGLREQLFSQIAPSCIGYTKKEYGHKPLFENQKYGDTTVITDIQKSALDFIDDICTTFRGSLDLIHILPHDASKPLEHYFNTATKKSMHIYKNFSFEDFISFGNKQIDLFSISALSSMDLTTLILRDFSTNKFKKSIFYMIFYPNLFFIKLKNFFIAKIQKLFP